MNFTNTLAVVTSVASCIGRSSRTPSLARIEGEYGVCPAVLELAFEPASPGPRGSAVEWTVVPRRALRSMPQLTCFRWRDAISPCSIRESI
jgi:hypothetical protein